jgi:hypothetical protein
LTVRGATVGRSLHANMPPQEPAPYVASAKTLDLRRVSRSEQAD